nr:hypothetical protein [uncultured bacterium]
MGALIYLRLQWSPIPMPTTYRFSSGIAALKDRGVPSSSIAKACCRSFGNGQTVCSPASSKDGKPPSMPIVISPAVS